MFHNLFQFRLEQSFLQIKQFHRWTFFCPSMLNNQQTSEQQKLIFGLYQLISIEINYYLKFIFPAYFESFIS